VRKKKPATYISVFQHILQFNPPWSSRDEKVSPLARTKEILSFSKWSPKKTSTYLKKYVTKNGVKNRRFTFLCPIRVNYVPI